MQSKAILFLFLFINMYYPISPFFVMGINIILFFIYGKYKVLRRDVGLLVLSFLLVCLVLFSSLFFSTTNNSFIIFKYIRTFVSIYLLLSIVRTIKIEIDDFLSIFAFVLILHSAVIILQIIYPPMSQILAPFFNFTRDTELLESLEVRKLGLTGSFDSSSVVLIMSEILFFYIYYRRKKILYIFLSLSSFSLTLFTSRLGLLIGLVIFMIFSFKLLISRVKRDKVIGASIIFVSVVFAINILMPLFVATNILHTSISSSTDISFFTQDYAAGNGTVSNLTGSHLHVYSNLTLLEKIIGKASDVSSDIGYIQLIYQVGWIGLFLIIYLHFIIIKKARLFRPKSDAEDIIKKFIIAYIIVLFVFNCKLLLMYSRAYLDILVILIGYLNNIQSSSKNYEI